MTFVQNLRSVPVSYNQSYVCSIPELLLVIAVFTKELGSRNLAGIDFDYIGYPFFILYFIYHLREMVMSGTVPWGMYIYLSISSIFSIFFLGLQWGGFLKQIFPIVIIFSVNFFIIRKYDWRNVFKLYVKFAFYSAIFGIIQWILSVNGIQVLIKIPGRLDSISYEPSHYASILIPALVYCFFYFKEYKNYFFVMLTALILTFNLTGYLVFTLILCLVYVSPVYFIISIPVLYYLIFEVFVDINENFNRRILETLAVFKGNINVLNSTLDANGTTVSMYSNLMVAQENIKNNPLTGSGLGGNEETYYRLYRNTPFRFNYYYHLNAKSAHSLTIRVISELGLIGIFLYVFTIIRNLFLFDKGMFRAISLACLSHFLCKTFKLGGIIDYGTPFFFAMLIINGIQYRYNKNLYGGK